MEADAEVGAIALVHRSATSHDAQLPPSVHCVLRAPLTPHGNVLGVRQVGGRAAAPARARRRPRQADEARARAAAQRRHRRIGGPRDRRGGAALPAAECARAARQAGGGARMRQATRARAHCCRVPVCIPCSVHHSQGAAPRVRQVRMRQATHTRGAPSPGASAPFASSRSASRPPPGSAVPTPVERRIRLELDGDMLTT